MQEKIGPVLILFEIVHSHLMTLSHTELKSPSFLWAFKRELFADQIPVLLGTIPKLVTINKCLSDITEFVNWVHNKEFVPVSDP